MMRPAVARPFPLSDESRRIRDLARCPQMIPGIHPIHVTNDAREQSNEAMARREVRGAAVVALWPVHAGGVSVWGGTPAGSANPVGTPMVLLQCGQTCCVP